MAKYRFYAQANAAQDRIWRSTAERWGEDRAATYIEGLHLYLEKLVETRALWRQLSMSALRRSEITYPVYFCRYQHHYIFFRELPDGVLGIMEILHERMDVRGRLLRLFNIANEQQQGS